MSAKELFQKACNKFPDPIDHIAAALGLHPNTVERWIALDQVPENYAGDLRRLLGGRGLVVDQFYTKPSVATGCYREFREVAAKLKIDLSSYWFIEPSAGCGNFYRALPRRRTIGLDIAPQGRAGKVLLKEDFLLWRPERKQRYAVIGNPPFGLRGHLALQFINHAGEFADLVAFILPQLFESDGKGVPAKRVRRDLKLAHSRRLDPDSFVDPSGVELTIATVFQVWTKINHENVGLKPHRTAKEFIRIYSLSDGGTPASTRNRHMIGQCDVYIPSTCFTGMKAYTSFEKLPNRRGYGIVIRRCHRSIRKLLLNHDWAKTAFPSTNSALNLRSSLIEGIVTARGFYDGRDKPARTAERHDGRPV